MLRHPLFHFCWLSLALIGCSRADDQMAPLLTITEPKGGAVTTGAQIPVSGYAFDDQGLKSIAVNGTEVLPSSERGQKLVNFHFRVAGLAEGQLSIDITASDQAGNRQELKLPLVLDNQKPALTIEEATLSGGRLQVRGLASDDVGVDRVVVHYGDTFNRLNLPQGESVPFAVNLPVESLTLIAVDAAGNRIEVKVP